MRQTVKIHAFLMLLWPCLDVDVIVDDSQGLEKCAALKVWVLDEKRWSPGRLKNEAHPCATEVRSLTS